jgi:DNA polymerase-3 subunit delta
MRIYHNKLASSLKQNVNQGLKPVWLVFGDELWQKNDSLQQIKQSAQQQGFSELIRFSADDKFDWQQVVDEYQMLSLFASQRIFEIELVTGKVGDAGSKAILALSERLQSDVLLIFHGPKLDAASTNRKWFKALEQQGCYLPLYEIAANAIMPWLQNQARQKQLHLAPDLSQLLVELCEGNMLALDQELHKLSLLFGQQSIGLDEAGQLLANQAKFNPFQIIDALLSGNCAKCIRMLDQQKQEGAAAGQLIWFLHKEIVQLYNMQEQISQGEKLTDLYKKYRIWDKRKPLYQHAMQHISLANIKLALNRLAQLDLISKTTSDFDAFVLLADVCISLFFGQETSKYSVDYAEY